MTNLSSSDFVVDINGTDAGRRDSTPSKAPSLSRAFPSSEVPEVDEAEPQLPTQGPYIFGPKNDGNHWENCLKAVEKYDDDMCKTWREEIDTLLVFAGLFTAIVTAFTIESYRWLQPDTAETTNQLLIALSAQLANSSATPAQIPSDFTPTASAIRINCLWFLSITISLTAGVVGILCKQWMREFQRDAALPAKDALAFRQLRYLGWKKWGVPQLIASPALLLQAALFLFLGGLLDMLWSEVRNKVVATCCLTVVSLAGLLMFLTTTLPVIYYLRTPDPSTIIFHIETGQSFACPWKSPQALLLLRFCLFLYNLLPNVKYDAKRLDWLTLERRIMKNIVQLCGTPALAIESPERSLRRYRDLALEWIQTKLAFNSNIRHNLFYCWEDSRYTCPQTGEHHASYCETKEECRAAETLQVIANVFFHDHNPRFTFEFCLREYRNIPVNHPDAEFAYSHALWAGVRFSDLNDSLPHDHTLTEQYLTLCTGPILGRGGNKWAVINSTLQLCWESPEYDASFLRVIEARLAELKDPDPQRLTSQVALAETIVDVMAVLIRDFSPLQSRPLVFFPLLELVKAALEKCSYNAEKPHWAEFLKELILRTTTIPRNFFEREADFQAENGQPPSITVDESAAGLGNVAAYPLVVGDGDQYSTQHPQLTPRG